MGALTIPKRLSTALLNSLGAGVVPRVGLEYIAVGRKEEIGALLEDLRNVEEGGAAFRFIVGRFGTGKSFLLQILRNHAMDRGFVVADADLSPERKLAGRDGQAVATYRELMRHLATKMRPEGGALAMLLERWIAGIQLVVSEESGLDQNNPRFFALVEGRILEVVREMAGMVHGYDFATVLAAYWRGYRTQEDTLKENALRWLRGEFNTKSEAYKDLGVRTIIDDNTWYDYIKLMANFVARVGYKGLIIFVDEAINLYNLQHSASRQANYETILAMFNDTMQGKVDHLGIFIGGTPQFIEDPRRGLFSYDALKSRLEESRFLQAGVRDFTGPLIRLPALTSEELFVLLQRLADVHGCHYGYDQRLTQVQLQEFLTVVYARIGANDRLTPREIERDFISVLNIIHQNPSISFEQVLHGDGAVFGQPSTVSEEDAEFAEFTL